MALALIVMLAFQTKRLFWTIVLIALLAGFQAFPASAGTPSDKYTIERYYTESEAESTTTSNTFQNKVTLTFTPPGTTDTNDYLIMASASVTHDGANYTVVQLTIDGTTYAITEFKPSGSSTQNYYPFAGHKIASLSRGSSHTVAIQYRSSNTGETAYIKDARIIVLEVTNYYTGEGDTESTTSTSYVDNVGANITFTPTSATDYLIIATADLAGSTTNKSLCAQLLYDTASWGEMQREPREASHYYSFAIIRKLTGDGDPHTVKIQFKSEANPAITDIKNGRVTAVKLSDIGSGQYNEAETETSTTSTTFVDKATISFTPSQAGDYLVLGSALVKQENTGYIVAAQLCVDETSANSTAWYRPRDGTDYISYMALKHLNLTAALHTIDLQYKTGFDDNSPPAFIKNARIIAIRVNTLESYLESTHVNVCNLFDAPSEDYVHIWGHGFTASHAYHVAYYDGGPAGDGVDGVIVLSDGGVTSNSLGVLSSLWHFPDNTGSTPGTWHAVVYDDDVASPPSTYIANDSNSVVEDDFDVTQDAIPEFSTVISAIVAVGLCFTIYYLMRRRLAHAQI